MPIESTEGCCCKPDLKTEAQRTNRFNTNSCNNLAAASSTPRNRLQSNSSISNDYKTQEKADVPCINIILKPTLDPKTEQKDKVMKIVEVSAVAENVNDNFIDDKSPSLLDINRGESQSRSSMRGKVKTKCVKVQTEDKKIFCDTSMQTAEPSNDQRSIGICKTNQSTPENRSVQFADNQIITDKFNSLNPNSNATEFSTKDNSSLWGEESTDVDGSTTIHSSYTECTRKTTGESSVDSTEYLDSMETLYKSIKNGEKINGASDPKTCIKNSGREDDVRLSERIKRKIDKLANTSQEMRSRTDFPPCNTDICEHMATQGESSHKTYTSVDKSNLATRNTDTLPSVFSNNSPIPQVLIDTTDTIEWELPSINESSKVTIGTEFSDSRVSSVPSNIPCCSDKNSTAGDIPSRSRNLTSEQDSSSKNISCVPQLKYPENNEVTVFTNKENKSTLTERNIDNFSRGFFPNDVTSLSEVGVAGNSSAETKSTNTSNEEKLVETNLSNFPQPREYQSADDTRFEDRSDFVLPSSITRNTVKASDLTRPEFIRMLTEIKEHTCSLEIQLSAMNEAMKRKQASRTKPFSSTLRNYEAPRQYKDTVRKKQTEESKTIHGSTCCVASEISSIENASYTPEELRNDNSSMDSLCCFPSDNNSPSENRHLKNESEDNNETCCGEIIATTGWEDYAPLKSNKKLETSSFIDRSNKPDEVILLPEDSNPSLRKHKPRKPVFKTKKSYLWAPLRHSDYRMWKRKLHKATPSAESIAVPGINSQYISPETSMVGPKVNVSCSPTSCCYESSEISPPVPVLKTMSEAGSMRSSIHSTTSNPFIDQTNAKSSFVSPTPEKFGTKYRISNESGSRSDHELAHTSNTAPQSPDLDSSKYSNVKRKNSKDTKIEPVVKAPNTNKKHFVSETYLFIPKWPKLKSKLGVKQSTFEDRTVNYPTVTPSNSRLSPLESRESLSASPRNVSLESSITQQDSNKRSSFRLNKLSCIPRLTRKPIHNQNPLDKRIQAENSQACIDATCCSPIICSEIIPEENISPNSNTIESLPAEEISTKSSIAHETTSGEQNTLVSVNNFCKHDSEEEVHSTDYAVNKSVEEYCCEEFKNNSKSKKRKRESGSRESKSAFNNSIDLEAAGNSENNSHLCEYQDNSGFGLNGKKKSKSVSNREGDDISENCCKSNSQQNNSKCTIRVTVSLDETPSNEEVKKIPKL